MGQSQKVAWGFSKDACTQTDSIYHHNCDQKMLAGLSSSAEISAKDLEILERSFKYTNIGLNVTILLLFINLYCAWIQFEKLEIILDFIN